MAEKGSIFQGTVRILLDPLKVKAWVELEKTGDVVWTEADILRMVAEEGIREGFKREELLRLVFEFNHSKEKKGKILFAEGIPPEAPRNEEMEWADLTLAPELKEIAGKVLKSAGPPQFFQLRAEGKKVQILINPNPDLVAFVEEGQTLATIYPPQPGKAGKDITGKPIPAPSLGHPSLNLSPLIEKERGSLKAKEQGILRKGPNWVDLVPYKEHFWSTEVSKDKTNGFFSYKPGHPMAPEPNPTETYQQILSLGLPNDYLLPEQDFVTKLSQAIRNRTPIERAPLTTERDGSYQIRVSIDRLRVLLDLFKPMGKGKPLPLKEMNEELKEMKIKSLNLDAVKTKVSEFMDSNDLEWQDILIAQGTSPGKEADKVLLYCIDFITLEEWKTIVRRIETNPILKETVPSLHIFSLEQVEKASEVVAGQKLAVLQVPIDAPAVPQGLDVFGDKVPPFPGNDPTIFLLAGIRRNGYGLEATQDGLLEAANLPQGIYLRVRKHRSGKAIITRSDDNMEAYMSLVPAWGTGTPLTRNMIVEALQNEQVFSGVLEEEIDLALAQARKGQKVENWVVARGRPTSGNIERQVFFYEKPKQVKLPDGSWQKTLQVKADSEFGEYTPPDGQALDGQDILGNIIPQSEENLVYLKISEEIQSTPKENSSSLILTAKKGGEIVLRGDSLSLKDHLTFKQGVTQQTGSIKFAGSVYVEGDVASGFYIMSGGDVKIKGVVNGALISSEGNIQISDGVRGEGKAVLRAKRHIGAGFIEKTTILPVGDLHINRSLHNCKVKCNGKVLQKNPDGTIVGGSIKTKFGLDAANLGSPKGVPTHISFGQDYLIEDQIEEEEKEVEKLRNSVIQLDALMSKSQILADPIKIMNARQKKVLILKMIQKRNLRLLNLRDKFESHFPSEIIIKGTLFPGVFVETHGRTYESKGTKTQLKLVFNLLTGIIEEKPLGSPKAEGLQISGPPPKPIL